MYDEYRDQKYDEACPSRASHQMRKTMGQPYSTPCLTYLPIIIIVTVSIVCPQTKIRYARSALLSSGLCNDHYFLGPLSLSFQAIRLIIKQKGTSEERWTSLLVSAMGNDE